MKVTKEKRLTYTNKATRIVKELSLNEKVYLMSGNYSLEKMISDVNSGLHYNYLPYPSGGVEKEKVPPVLFCDGPRGVVCGTGQATCFPVSMLRGASFNVELEHKIGQAIGKEIRAFGGNFYGGVCINLPYNPGWGRSQETYGEDSYHIGEMGVALATGVQEEQVIACIKHYAFNQMERARFKVSIDCDIRTEREVFLPHFKRCIDSGAASVMSSYNLYKGVKCGHHDYLLNQVLKDEWDFDGFVMSDFIWGVTDTVEAANGGQDMEMCATQFFGNKLVDVVNEGLVPEEKIDEAAVRIVRTILAFDDGAPTYSQDVIGCDDHIALAKQCAEEGITLIKNDGVLPFSKDKVKNIAVIGKLGNLPVIGDYGSSRVYPKYVVTPFQGISNSLPDAKVIFYSGEDIEHSKELAKDSDAVVFVVGYNHDDEGEYISENEIESYGGSIGGDRIHSLGLHTDDIKLVSEVGVENANTAVVLIGGNMIMMEEWKESVPSILMAYYPGMEGGNALAKILFGDVSPSGKLPYVVPFRESDLPQVDWEAEEQYYEYYHGYAKLEKENVKPSVPFGFGLTYTTFDFSGAEFKVRDGFVVATCDIKNVGNRKGTEVAQLYIGFSNSSINRPVKLLRGFTRVELSPGESKSVELTCPIERLGYYDKEKNGFIVEEMDYEVFLGNSSDPADLIAGVITI